MGLNVSLGQCLCGQWPPRLCCLTSICSGCHRLSAQAGSTRRPVRKGCRGRSGLSLHPGLTNSQSCWCDPVCTFLSQGRPPLPPPMQPGVLETAVSFCGDGTERIRLYSLLPRLMGAQTTQPLAFCVFGKNGEILPANRFFWLIPRKMDVFLD